MWWRCAEGPASCRGFCLPFFPFSICRHPTQPAVLTPANPLTVPATRHSKTVSNPSSLPRPGPQGRLTWGSPHTPKHSASWVCNQKLCGWESPLCPEGGRGSSAPGCRAPGRPPGPFAPGRCSVCVEQLHVWAPVPAVGGCSAAPQPRPGGKTPDRLQVHQGRGATLIENC